MDSFLKISYTLSPLTLRLTLDFKRLNYMLTHQDHIVVNMDLSNSKPMLFFFSF